MAVNISAIGNLGDSPRPVRVRNRVAGFSVSVCATPRKRVSPKSDEWEDVGEPLWLRATFWKDSDEWDSNREVLEEVSKGARVRLEGSLSLREYNGNLYHEVSFATIEKVDRG